MAALCSETFQDVGSGCPQSRHGSAFPASTGLLGSGPAVFWMCRDVISGLLGEFGGLPWPGLGEAAGSSGFRSEEELGSSVCWLLPGVPRGQFGLCEEQPRLSGTECLNPHAALLSSLDDFGGFGEAQLPMVSVPGMCLVRLLCTCVWLCGVAVSGCVCGGMV